MVFLWLRKNEASPTQRERAERDTWEHEIESSCTDQFRIYESHKKKSQPAFRLIIRLLQEQQRKQQSIGIYWSASQQQSRLALSTHWLANSAIGEIN